MEPFEWIALVGAAAWLPQIGVVIYRVLTKPQVVFIPVPEFELGYTYFGPIVNIKGSLFAEKKDAIVLDMQLALEHERGAKLQLTWQSFVEEFSEVRDASGEFQKISRDQMATALRLSTAVPSEKFIRFQDSAFQDTTRELVAIANNERARLKSTDPDSATAQFQKSKEITALVSHFRHGFPWEAGRYTLRLEMSIQGRKSPAIARSSFTISQAEIDRLRPNIEVTEAAIRAVAADEKASENYSWVNPRLGSKDIMVRR